MVRVSSLRHDQALIACPSRTVYFSSEGIPVKGAFTLTTWQSSRPYRRSGSILNRRMPPSRGLITLLCATLTSFTYTVAVMRLIYSLTCIVIRLALIVGAMSRVAKLSLNQKRRPSCACRERYLSYWHCCQSLRSGSVILRSSTSITCTFSGVGTATWLWMTWACLIWSSESGSNQLTCMAVSRVDIGTLRARLSKQCMSLAASTWPLNVSMTSMSITLRCRPGPGASLLTSSRLQGLSIKQWSLTINGFSSLADLTGWNAMICTEHASRSYLMEL